MSFLIRWNVKKEKGRHTYTHLPVGVPTSKLYNNKLGQVHVGCNGMHYLLHKKKKKSEYSFDDAPS